MLKTKRNSHVKSTVTTGISKRIALDPLTSNQPHGEIKRTIYAKTEYRIRNVALNIRGKKTKYCQRNSKCFRRDCLQKSCFVEWIESLYQSLLIFAIDGANARS